MRLNTILDTMVLAEMLDGSFGFYWDETKTREIDQQTTDSAAAVFSETFLARHRITDPAIAGRAADARTFGKGTEETLFRLEAPLNPPKVFPSLADRVSPDFYARTFARIGFSDEVAHAIRAARTIKVPPGFAVIHLRGGDVLHGTHSHMGTYLNKAPAVPEIAALVKRLTKTHPAVWLVGQEPDVQQAIASLFPGIRAFGITQDAPELTPVARVIFDAVFMSRAARIMGGFSGVTHLSRRIGDAIVVDIAKHRVSAGLDQLLADPMAQPEWSGISSNAKAHTYIKAFMTVPPEDWNRDHSTLVRLARKYRRESKFIAFMEICVLVRLGEMAEAELLASTWLTTRLAKDADPGVIYAFLTGGHHYFPATQASVLLDRDFAAGSALACLALLTTRFVSPESPSEKLLLPEWDAAIDPALRTVLDTPYTGP